jgi:hypothetical protein
VLRLPRRPAGRRPVGRLRGPGRRPPVDGGHGSARVLGHKRHHRHLRPPPRREGHPRPRCAGGTLLARVRRGRQRSDPGTLGALAPGGPGGGGRRPDARAGPRLGPGGGRDRRAGAELGAGDGARLPCAFVRLDSRRGRPSGDRPLARQLPRRRGRESPRPRALDRAAGRRAGAVRDRHPTGGFPLARRTARPRLAHGARHERPLRPLRLRRDVEPARHSRRRDAVVEWCRERAGLGPPLRRLHRRGGRPPASSRNGRSMPHAAYRLVAEGRRAGRRRSGQIPL